jgi:hypothetical protein
VSPAVSARNLLQTVEAGRPADVVVVTRLLVLEELLRQHQRVPPGAASKVTMTSVGAASLDDLVGKQQK